MTASFDFSQPPEEFTGCVPLFPLPNLVLFPHILQPLHIFEPRYRRMVADALAGERLLAMALLKPGWEQHEPAAPPIYPTVCVGRITAEERLPSGKYNLILQGLFRAAVLDEEDTGLPYRIGRLRLESDVQSPAPAEREEAQRAALIAGFRDLFSQQVTEREISQIFSTDLSTGVLCDILAYAVKMEPSSAQEILAELSVDRRCELLLRRIREVSSARDDSTEKPTFPPKFSLN